MNQRDKRKYKLLDNTYDCHMYPMGQRIRDLDNEKELTQKEVVDLLNEQQATISALNEENKQLRKTIKTLNKKRILEYKDGGLLDE